LTDSQTMGYYIQNKEYPFLHNFEEQCKKFEKFNYTKLDHSKVFQYMMAPACIYPKHSVDAAIDNSSILYIKNLTKQRSKSPSVDL